MGRLRPMRYYPGLRFVLLGRLRSQLTFGLNCRAAPRQIDIQDGFGHLKGWLIRAQRTHWRRYGELSRIAFAESPSILHWEVVRQIDLLHHPGWVAKFPMG